MEEDGKKMALAEKRKMIREKREEERKEFELELKRVIKVIEEKQKNQEKIEVKLDPTLFFDKKIIEYGRGMTVTGPIMAYNMTIGGTFFVSHNTKKQLQCLLCYKEMFETILKDDLF